MAAELACFIRGYNSLTDFNQMGCKIWDGNAKQTTGSMFRPRFEGDLGRIYGVQWRRWRSAHHLASSNTIIMDETDQLANLVAGLRRDPYGRRHIVSAWNPGELADMCLPPCHMFFQCYAEDDTAMAQETFGEQPHLLTTAVYLRSLDLFLGMPFDVASYALLTHLIARELGWGVGRLILVAGDAHVYRNHADAVREVLSREPLPPCRLQLADGTDLFSFMPSEARLVEYKSHGPVAAPLNL